MKTAAKFNFKGTWYPTHLVRKAACATLQLSENRYETNEQLEELVDALIKGPPTYFSKFMVSLNKGTSK